MVSTGRFFCLLFCLSGAVLLAQTAKQPAAAPISDQINRELPPWLRFGGEERVRVEGFTGINFKTAEDTFLLNRLRLNVDVKPSSWLRFSFQAQDARVFGQNTLPAPASQKDAMDLRLGYAEIGKAEGPLVLRAGRQGLVFGEGRLVADPNWSNVGRSFDAVRLTARYKGIKVDLFAGDVVKVDAVSFDEPTAGEHFHGAYGSLDKLIPNATIEPYLFWRLAHNNKSEAGRLGHLDTKTAGFRWVGKLPLSLDYGAEVALQRGSITGDDVSAWAGHWGVGHTLSGGPHRPRLFLEFNRASGDANSKDGVRGGFDPLYPSAHDKYGLADLFTWTNLAHGRVGAEYTIRKGLTAAAAYNSFWLADPHDGLYVGGKLFARSADGSAGRRVGQEADIQAMWTIFRTTQINVGYARLFPGEFLRKTTPAVPYNWVFTNVVHRF